MRVICVHTCVGAGAHARWEQSFRWCLLLDLCLHLSFEADFSLNPELTHWLHWQASKFQGSPCLHPAASPSTDIYPRLLHRHQDPNSLVFIPACQVLYQVNHLPSPKRNGFSFLELTSKHTPRLWKWYSTNSKLKIQTIFMIIFFTSQVCTYLEV